MSQNEKITEESNNSAGIKLNAKSVIGICVLLVAIMVFAGILTQVMPRGEYYTYPENTYKLESGEFVTVADGEAVYTVDGDKEIGFDEYLSKLKTAGVNIETVESSDGIDTETAEDVSEMVINGTYHEIDYTMPIWKIVFSLILVFGSENVTTGIAIIMFIVLIGGTFLILDERGILKYIMAVIIRKYGNKKYLLLWIMIFVCMLLSSTAGILEESVTLVPIATAITLALGWDSLVGLSVSLVAIAFGFTAATFNPFNVMTVQKLADIPVFSGLWLRVVTFILVYIILAVMVTIYAKRIEKDPSKSICYESDRERRGKYNAEEYAGMVFDDKTKAATKAFVTCLAFVMVCIIADFVFKLNGYLSMPGMAIMFTVGGLTAGKKSGLRGKELFKGFMKGVKTIAPAIPLVFFILAITYILSEGMIIHTILNYVYGLISNVSPYSAILLLLGFVVILEFFIGSGTAKAFLIMPIVAPLAQLVGISGNTVVLTFCMGDGFTNLLYPTSGIMIIAIGIVGISYGKWLKYMWKIFLAEGLLSVALIHFALMVNYV